jgi:hypothetical protein
VQVGVGVGVGVLVDVGVGVLVAVGVGVAVGWANTTCNVAVVPVTYTTVKGVDAEGKLIPVPDQYKKLPLLLSTLIVYC